jgi:hypothetical protein
MIEKNQDHPGGASKARSLRPDIARQGRADRTTAPVPRRKQSVAIHPPRVPVRGSLAARCESRGTGQGATDSLSCGGGFRWSGARQVAEAKPERRNAPPPPRINTGRGRRLCAGSRTQHACWAPQVPPSDAVRPAVPLDLLLSTIETAVRGQRLPGRARICRRISLCSRSCRNRRPQLVAIRRGVPHEHRNAA